VICKLPAEKYRNYGEGRWFFFTDRERKHLGGNRPNRTTPDNGHWNATGSIRPIRSAGGVLVGCRRTLVFYEASRSRKKKSQAGLLPTEEEEGEGDGGQQAAKAKDGVKTEWTMYVREPRLRGGVRSYTQRQCQQGLVVVILPFSSGCC